MNSSFRLNGKVEVLSAISVEDLLRQHGIDPARVRFLAVAVNGAVVPRGAWGTRPLAPDDEVEIVRPLQGG